MTRTDAAQPPENGTKQTTVATAALRNEIGWNDIA